MLEATKSDHLISKLQEGYQRNSRSPSTQSPRPAIENLSLEHTRRPGMAPRSDSVFSGTGGLIRYEVHFPPPDEGSKVNVLRHHVTTRNFFAMLLGKPLVGLTLYQALIDLHQRLQLYMPLHTDCAQLLMDYLTSHHFNNVCNDPAAAAGLLCWSEDHDVQWWEGWREGFVHCCGMYTRLRLLPECKDISSVSLALLERSFLELQVRVRSAETKLLNFNFDDMWTGSEVQLHPSRAVFDQFSRFLQHYHEKSNKRWPPPKAQETAETWLTRNLVARLHLDFGALYDHLVDRDVVWEKTRQPGKPHLDMIRLSDEKDVEINKNHLCLASLFARYDQKHNYLQIPHPYPLLPALTLIDIEPKPSKSRFFSSKAKTIEKRIIQANSEASNSTFSNSEKSSNGLVEAFLRFEKTDNLGDSNPQSARKARWVLIYGVLQVLSTLFEDTPGLFFKDVTYFLSPRLRGCPPWERDDARTFVDASSTASYCWKESS